MRAELGLAALLATVAGSVSLAADLPPHTRAVWGGWVECTDGYLMRGRTCVSEAEMEADNFIVSDLPSAGEGAPGTCPSGGCASVEAPSYYAYSAPAIGGWANPYGSGWWYSQQYRDRRSWPRNFATSGFQNVPRRLNAVPERRAHAGFAGGQFFGGSSRGRGRRF